MGDVGTSQHQLVVNGYPGEDRSGRKLPQYIAALAATLGALSTGIVLGWSSPAGPKLKNGTEYDFDISSSQVDWISSMPNLGAAAICFPIGMIMDRIGRRLTMLLLVLPFVLGWVCIVWASAVEMLMIGRFITGMAGGAFCVTAPTYTSEIAQAEIRGTLGSFFQLMITIGILFAYAVGSYVSVYVFSILCGLVPLVFGIIFFFMPESPAYLIEKGQYERAKEALIRLRGFDYDCDSELKVLHAKAEETKANPVSFRTTLSTTAAKKAMIVTFALMVLQQFSGINAVIFNTTAIFKSAGVSIPAEIATIIIGSTQVLTTLLSTMIIDRLGRRILLLFSALVMALCGIVLGVFFYLQVIHGPESDIVKSIGWVPVVALSLFIFAFSLGMGPIPWMIASELCSIDIKAFVSAAGATFNWLLSFAITTVFNSLILAMGDAQVYWMFAGITIAGFIFVFFVVPETKGKTAIEIQAILSGTPTSIPSPSRTVI